MMTWTCEVVPEVLSPAECQAIVRRAQKAGYVQASEAYPPSYRNNDRLVVDDTDLADSIFEKVHHLLPKTLIDPDGSQWRLRGINERFRFCRYQAGQFFKIHRDGVYRRSEKIESKLTFMVYLNGHSEFEGGFTRFFETRDPQSQLLAEIRPEAGALIYFDHNLWHDGAEVLSGEKFIMRSDILYERMSDGAKGLLENTGYVWTAAELSNGLVATGARDKNIKIWQILPERTLRQTIEGHQNSVTSVLGFSSGQLWSASRDQTIRIWKSQSSCFELTKILRSHTGAVLSLAKNLNESIIASGSADKRILLWNKDGELLSELSDHSGWIWSLQFIDDTTLVSVSEDGSIRLWCTDQHHCLGAYQCGNSPLRTLAVSPRKDRLAVGHANGTISLWSLNKIGTTFQLEFQYAQSAHAGEVRALLFTDEDLLVSGGEDDQVNFWSVPSFSLIGSGEHQDFVTSLTLLSDGRVLSTSYDGDLRFWKVPSM